MKSGKVRILFLLMSVVILLGLNPLLASGAETSGLQETAHLYYSSKAYWFIIRVHSKKDAVQYRESFNPETKFRLVEIDGQPTKDIGFFIRLTFDEKTGEEQSQLISKDQEVELQGVMTGIQYLRNHQLNIGEEKELNVLSGGNTYRLLIKIKGKKNLTIDNIAAVAYKTEVVVEDKNGNEISKIDLWFIKGGKLDGYIARFKIELRSLRLVLTLNKASKI